VAFESQTAYVTQRYAHLLTLEQDYDRVQQEALRRSVRHCYGTAGRNISNLGINTFSPDPLRQYIGNANYGRVLKTKPQDMRGKWEYDLDDQGCVLQARWHEDRVDSLVFADNILVASAVPEDATYLHYTHTRTRGILLNYAIIYTYGADGRLDAILKCWWGGDMTRSPYFELLAFSWNGDRLLGVDEYAFTVWHLAICPDVNRAVSILGQPFHVNHRHFPAWQNQ